MCKVNDNRDSQACRHGRSSAWSRALSRDGRGRWFESSRPYQLAISLGGEEERNPPALGAGENGSITHTPYHLQWAKRPVGQDQVIHDGAHHHQPWNRQPSMGKYRQGGAAGLTSSGFDIPPGPLILKEVVMPILLLAGLVVFLALCWLSGRSKDQKTTPPNKDIWGAKGELPRRFPNKDIWG